METTGGFPRNYFVFEFPLSDQAWHRYAVRTVLPPDLAAEKPEPARGIRLLADRINNEPERQAAGQDSLPAELLLALRTVNQALRFVAGRYFLKENPGSLDRSREWTNEKLGSGAVGLLYQVFLELFPPLAVQTARTSPRAFLDDEAAPVAGRDLATIEMILLFLNRANPAAREAGELFEDKDLRRRASYVPFVTGLEEFLDGDEPPAAGEAGLFSLLRAPMQACPHSLSGQLEYMKDNWGHLLPDELLEHLQLALDVLQEADVARAGGAGPAPVLEFGPGSDAWDADLDEPEAFSADADWMSHVVLIAKSVYVWLDQLSRTYGRPVNLLSDVPDEELDRMARRGINGLWLIGLWERSDASRKIKQYTGNPEAAASAYALKRYEIAADLGGREAWQNLRDRAWSRGVRLASDMVPNHMGIDSDWVVEHPEYFLQAEHPPYPAYSFTGGDLCDHPGVGVRIEDGYWNRSDAAVVFQRVDEGSGHARYIYHGNDGTSMPWNDTAQLNFLLPEVREAVVRVILDVARMFPIIRFDAAMTLARKHYQRLWFPAPGDAGAIPSRAEHGMSKPEFEQVFPAEFWREVVDRVALEVPDTLLLAEAFWLMEGFFVRTLGMHRVYNSAFMNMLKMEENGKYRQTIRNVLEYSPAILGRFVNFMNNPDEKTAVEQFGRGDKYFGCTVLLATMPGLPMLGHGQIEGFSEKYGMEYRRAYWDEHEDAGLIARHEHEIFPLLRRRRLFSGSEHFRLYDFVTDAGHVDENVFAYSNGEGGERTLVFYNNAYESATGRVHHSLAVNTGPAEQPHLVGRELAEALNLAAGGDWIRCREIIGRREHLLPARPLRDGGWHLHLHGYEYRVFLDFRTLDDPDGDWARLAERLSSEGAEDLDREMRRMRMEPLLASLDEPADPVPTLEAWEELAEAGAPKTLGKATRAELEELLDEVPGSGVLAAVHLAGLLTGLADLVTDEAKAAGVATVPGDEDLVAEELAHHLAETSGWKSGAWPLLELSRWLADSGESLEALAGGETDWLVEALDEPRLQRLLETNRHAGSLWLNREALHRLLLAMTTVLLLEESDQSPVALLDARALVEDAANEAGYRVEELVKRLAGKGLA